MADKLFDDLDLDSLRETTDSIVPTGYEYLSSRKIAKKVIESHTVEGDYRFNGKPVHAVGFQYKTGAIKWRSTTGKEFSQQGTCEDFFLLETHKPGNSILICEGEVDALSWLSVGLPDNVTVLSVPNGAPQKVGKAMPDPDMDGRFKYIWRAKDQISQAPRVYLNTDSDGPGTALAEEISRRVGRSRIWTIDLGTKDASEALQQHGASYLVEKFHASQPLPLIGLHGADEFVEALESLYTHGQMRGAYVGIDGIDNLLCIPLSMMTVVTGFPGSGKSDLIDQICYNLASNYGWKTVYCSFEKPVAYHMAQLAQKHTKKPFFGNDRMTEDDLHMAHEWIKDHFMFMDSSNGGPTDIDGILDTASAAVMRMGCRVLVIDPYNYITMDKNSSETDAISSMLTKIRMWARRHDAHVFFIAHPTKIYEHGKHVCTGMDVSGSAAWYAKTDLGITTWRHPRDMEPPEFHVWKVRWSWMGRLGSCRLTHDPKIGTWRDYDHVDDGFDWDF